MKLSTIALVLSSAVLVSLSFHPLGLHFLAWFGLVPLFWVVHDMRPRAAFKIGIVFGFMFSLMSLFWLVFLKIETGVRILLIFGLILLFLYFGLYYGVGLLLATRFGQWILPFALAGLEFIRGMGEIGFPWLSLGYSQSRYPLVIQQASLYGVYGITFWLTLVNLLLVLFLKRRHLRYALVCAVVFFLPLAYGWQRIHVPMKKPVLVAVIQPNIDPNLKFTRALREETFDRLIRLSKECHDYSQKTFGTEPELIVWPETATPVFITLPGIYRETVMHLSKEINTPILTGTPLYDFQSREMYNGAVVIEPGKDIVQEYRKLHLVPFGEHIPFGEYLPLLRKIDVGGGDYLPGREYTVFRTRDITFACLICFESIFPELSRTFVKHGAEFLVNITNDGWFGKISGPQQHNDMAILRTVENGVPLARSSNTGISMIVDKSGRILQETGLFTMTYICDRVDIQRERTLYQWWGDVVPVFSLCLIAVLVFASLVKPRKTTPY